MTHNRQTDQEQPIGMHLKLHASLVGHSGEIHALEFSPDGRWLASVQADSTYLWNVGGQELKAIILFPASVPVFSHDASLFAYGGPHFVHLATIDGAIIDRIQTHATFVLGVNISHEGDLLVIGDSSHLRIRDIMSKNEIALTIGGDVGPVSSDEEGDVLDGEKVEVYEQLDVQERGIYGIRFVAEGQVLSFIYQHRIGYLPVSSLRDALQSRASEIPSTRSADTLITWTTIPDSIGDPATDHTYSRDQTLLITQREDDDGSIRIQLVNVETLQVQAQVHVTDGDRNLVSFALSPDNRTLAVLTDDGYVWFFDMISAQLLGTYAFARTSGEADIGQGGDGDTEGEGIDFEEVEDAQERDVVGDLSWSPDGKLLAAGGIALLRYYDPSSFPGSEPDFSVKVFEFTK